MFYNANADIVFNIVFDLTSEVYYGCDYVIYMQWCIIFFLCCVFTYGAWNLLLFFFVPTSLVWLSGGIIWVLMIATAFLGYILPWGQMSFWGAMVITSLLGALPGIGADILLLLWGSYSIDILRYIVFIVCIIRCLLLFLWLLWYILRYYMNLDLIRFRNCGFVR